MEMEGTIGQRPGDNGGQQKGGIATAGRPNLATLVGTAKGTETEEGRGLSSVKELRRKKELIEKMRKVRRQYVTSDAEDDTETVDEIAEIERNGRVELEEIILGDKKGVNKFVTKVGLKLHLIDPYKMIVSGKKELEGEIRKYARDNGRYKKDISRTRKEVDAARAKLEGCFETRHAINDVRRETEQEIKEKKDAIDAGVKKGESVATVRSELRRKEDYMRQLEEDELENAYMVTQLETDLAAKKDYLASVEAAREETLGKIYDLKGSLPQIHNAGARTRKTIDTAQRDGKVLTMRNKLAEMADIANTVAYEVEATARGNSVSMRYNGDSQSEAMKEALERREETRTEAEKAKRDLLDHVKTSEQRYYEGLAS